MTPLRPDVTVIIPSHNRPDLVRRAIATALAQVGVELEIVVVDDGSVIPVASFVDHPQVRVFRNEQAQGVAHARNRGIAAARGEWIAFLDDDDLWSPSKLRKQLEALHRTGLHWSHTGTICLNDDLHVRWMGVPGSEISYVEYLRQSNFVGTPSCVMVQTQFARETGGFDARFSIMADWDMWIRYGDREPGVAVQVPLIGYVTHIGSMHRQGIKPIIRELRRLQLKHRGNGTVGGVRIWGWIADTHLDSGHRWSALPLFFIPAIIWRDRQTLVAGLRSLAPQRLRHKSKGAGVGPRWVTRWYDQPATQLPTDEQRALPL
jgi:glycosyltransferase involved in cell wall biosynthesis